MTCRVCLLWFLLVFRLLIRTLLGNLGLNYGVGRFRSDRK